MPILYIFFFLFYSIPYTITKDIFFINIGLLYFIAILAIHTAMIIELLQILTK